MRDSFNLLKWFRQLVPALFHGHGAWLLRVTNPDTHDAFVEFSNLDGAVVNRGYRFIQSGEVLATIDFWMQLPAGLEQRHMAAVVRNTNIVAIAVDFRQPVAMLEAIT